VRGGVSCSRIEDPLGENKTAEEGGYGDFPARRSRLLGKEDLPEGGLTQSRPKKLEDQKKEGMESSSWVK